MEDRDALLRRDGMLVGLATAGLVNGMHVSPWFDIMTAPIAAMLSGFSLTSPVLIFYFTSLVISVFTIMLAGVPAAIDEQRRGVRETDGRSLAIWLCAAVLLALPAFLRMIGAW